MDGFSKSDWSTIYSDKGIQYADGTLVNCIHHLDIFWQLRKDFSPEDFDMLERNSDWNRTYFARYSLRFLTPHFLSFFSVSKKRKLSEPKHAAVPKLVLSICKFFLHISNHLGVFGQVYWNNENKIIFSSSTNFCNRFSAPFSQREKTLKAHRL